MIQVLNVIALWMVWWCAAAALVGGREVRSWSSLILGAGLILVTVSAFIGAITLYVQPRSIRWWASGFIYGVAIVSVWLYDYRFGVAKQLRMLAAWFQSIVMRVRSLASRRPA